MTVEIAPPNERTDAAETPPDAFLFEDGLEAKDGSEECEPCDVGTVFVRIANAESLGDGRTPEEVRETLDAFFKTATNVAHENGGYAEKPDLCAVLCVFGAPSNCRRAADAALAGGRELRDRLERELPDTAFSIGISLGASVAGWIRTMGRFEPLVMHAPVSEARRLCDLAKRGGALLLASERAVMRASSEEARRWTSGRGAWSATESGSRRR